MSVLEAWGGIGGAECLQVDVVFEGLGLRFREQASERTRTTQAFCPDQQAL